MAVLNIIQAVNDALRHEMTRDDRVVVFGEDVGHFGGVFRATVDLQKEFGVERCFDTPLAEQGILGFAVGMAVYGMRPVAEIQFADYIWPAFDQITNEAAKYRYRSGGRFTCPLVVRTPYGGGIHGGHYHSQSPESYFTQTPGLKVVVPADPYEAKGLLLSAIRDPDPVIFLEPKRIYRASKAEVPEGEYTIPLGKARIVREGRQVTLIAYGAQVHVALEAAELAAQEGIDVEVIDLRTLLPFDVETIVESAKKTGRIVITHEAPKTCGYGAEMAATLAERAFLYLEAPIQRVTGWDTPFPFSLDKEYMPDAKRVLQGIRRTMTF